MRVLLTIDRSSPQTYLVRLLTKSLIKEIRSLIEAERHSEAVRIVFSRGTFERIVAPHEIPHVEADLMLSKSGARWDVVRGR